MEHDTYHNSLRLKMIAITLIFALVPMLVLGGTIYYQFYVAYRSHLAEDARVRIENKKNFLDFFFEQRIAQLLSLAHDESLERMKDEDYLAKLFNSMHHRSKAFVDIGIIDDQGNHVAYVGPYYEQLKTANYAGQEWFSKVMESGIYLSDVFLGFRKIPHFVIAVTGVSGHETFIVRATVDSERIEEIVKQAQMGKNGDSFLVNSNNVLQTSSRFSGSVLTNPRSPDFSLISRTTLDMESPHGDGFLYAATPLTGVKWVSSVRNTAGSSWPRWRKQGIGML